MSRKALIAAREALIGHGAECKDVNDALALIDEALAVPVQEPIGYFTVNDYDKWEQIDGTSGKPLYDRPAAQRQWIGLDEMDIADVATSHLLTWVNLNAVENRNYFARAVEAKLKEKNA